MIFPEWLASRFTHLAPTAGHPQRAFTIYLVIRAPVPGDRRAQVGLDYYGPRGWVRQGSGEYLGYAPLPETGWLSGIVAPDDDLPVLVILHEAVPAMHQTLDTGLHLGRCRWSEGQREWLIKPHWPIDPEVPVRGYVRVNTEKLSWLPLPRIE